MKTKIETPKQKFNPASLTITFETQKELDFYGSLFNTVHFVDAIRTFGVEPLSYDDFEKMGANVNELVRQIEARLKR